jgi:D-sedoheptulose 7-phosphate isomerase
MPTGNAGAVGDAAAANQPPDRLIVPAWVTPLSEAFQAVVWHCLVSHPSLQRRQTKW